MVEDTKKVSSSEKPSAIKPKVTPKKKKSTVTVKNISKHTICTSLGQIEVGENGECSLAESRTYSKYLKVV